MRIFCGPSVLISDQLKIGICACFDLVKNACQIIPVQNAFHSTTPIRSYASQFTTHAPSSPSFCLWAHLPPSPSCTSKRAQFRPATSHAARRRPRTRCQTSPETKAGDRFVPCLCGAQGPAPREIKGEFTWPQCRQRAVTSNPELRRLVI